MWVKPHVQKSVEVEQEEQFLKMVQERTLRFFEKAEGEESS